MAATDKSLEASNLAEIWKAIFRPGAAEENQFANKYYTWHRPLSIQALLGQPRTWTSWSYRAAYPKLSTLLEQASLENKLRCRVNFVELAIDNDRYDLRKLSYNEAHAPLSVIFDALNVIPTQMGRADHSEVKIEGIALIKKLARILHITDISPLVLNCIFGTSSGLDISHIAAFVDRNLNGLNWAKVNLLQMRNAGWSSYIYEYHFSFYYVTFDYFEPDTVKPDPRKIRRSCPFGKRKNLMADDPQFSLSKTYFWALQTYKLFERTLEQTIATWETFKIDSLPKIQDGRISPENWDASVRSIDQAIELLKPKINRIKRGIQDVRDLREGLQSTAAVFDSRTAVRQGENIRLLTYITLLFLPLSFGTVGSVFFMAFDSAVRKATFGLQRQMRLHHRNDWKDRALALYQDDISTESPVRKASKESSRWVYILFLFEVAMVVIPVSELNAALHFYGLFGSEQERERDAVDDDYSDKDDGSSHRPRKGRQKEVLMRVKRAAKQAEEEERKRKDEERGWAIALLRRSYRNTRHLGSALMHTIFTSARVLLLPIWVPILLVEYIITVLAFTLLFNQHPSQANPSSAMPEEESLAVHSLSPFIRAWRTLGLNTLTLPTRHHHPHDNPSSPRLSDTFSHEPHLSNVRSKEQTPTETKLQSPQWSATATATTKLQGTHDASKHPGEHSPVVASPETLQEEEDITPIPFTDVEVSVFDPRRSRRTPGARLHKAAFSARRGNGAGKGA
ncbi:CorA-like Mg2+ transporter domain family protein [Histoplasma capsulatum]|uniref:CorA-like Mg2+ transporter domain family protein n=1 Tax=Ajellomyces capsulatus TaxID=5037 RepID=A0A8A1MDP1_AJECA|nr:predicted protein [Histoplasma mississippiense (nom. inval.)]EDN10853.1 predicted protein [Histoplasma mississippiense (nom. inval.)]QSS64005.1 CorA-like Mg2+ transporter domain family protein [Histoplasma capsulatum]